MTFSSVNCARNVRDDSFSFYCAECHFSLHSHCDRSIPTTLKHSRHTHPFILCILLELFFYARDILLLYYSQLSYLPRLWYSLFAIYRQTQDTHTSTQLTFYPPPIKENPEDEDEDEDKLKLSFYPCMKENPEDKDKDKDKDEHKDEDEDKDGNKNEDEDVDEYYYDACEQSRLPYGLLYFCEECDFVAHAPCIASSIQLTPAS
ncbi:unnamed protein product [Camellia sinensis]